MLLFLIMFPTWPKQMHNQYTVLTKTEIRLYLDGFCVCLKNLLKKKKKSDVWISSYLKIISAVSSPKLYCKPRSYIKKVKTSYRCTSLQDKA